MSGAAAAGAAASAAGVVVVALAFALYALAKDYVGAAGASAITALVFAVVMGLGAALMSSRAKGGKAKPKKGRQTDHAGPRTLLERAMDTARERPVIAAAGALAAGLLALRNPALVATAIGLINQPPRPRRD